MFSKMFESVMLGSDGCRAFLARGLAYELERPLANFCATSQLLILSSVGGSQARPRLVYGDGTNHVGRVRRTLTSVDCVHHDAQLEVHTTVDGQPVKLPQSWCHVIIHP